LILWLLSFYLSQFDIYALLDVNAILRVYHLESQKRDTLQNLLNVSSIHGASDERDKVFAILSLVGGGQPFQADYMKPLAEAHYDALNTLFKDRSDFEFLTWTQDDGNACEGPLLLPDGWIEDFILRYQLAGFNVRG
jgi:hypothetical protein